MVNSSDETLKKINNFFVEQYMEYKGNTVPCLLEPVSAYFWSLCAGTGHPFNVLSLRADNGSCKNNGAHHAHLSHGSTMQLVTCRRLGISIRTVGLLQHTKPKWIPLAGRLFMYNSLFPCNDPEAFSTEELNLSPD